MGDVLLSYKRKPVKGLRIKKGGNVRALQMVFTAIVSALLYLIAYVTILESKLFPRSNAVVVFYYNLI